jgi:hypothetical protein
VRPLDPHKSAVTHFRWSPPVCSRRADRSPSRIRCGSKVVPNMGSDPRHDRVNDRQCSPASIPVSRTRLLAGSALFLSGGRGACTTYAPHGAAVHSNPCLRPPHNSASQLGQLSMSLPSTLTTADHHQIGPSLSRAACGMIMTTSPGVSVSANPSMLCCWPSPKGK